LVNSTGRFINSTSSSRNSTGWLHVMDGIKLVSRGTF
jgi:hypothetical protein